MSTLLLALISALGLTGLLSFVLPYSTALAGIHVWFGFTFLLVVVLHLCNNGRALLSYFRRAGGRARLLTGVGLVTSILLGVALYVPPFSAVLEAGHKLRKIQAVEDGEYQIISTRATVNGASLTIDVRAGDEYESDPQPLFLGLTYTSTPQLVFWLEDMDGNYIDTLYVTKKLAESSFRLVDDFFSKAPVRRPEALPYWSHKRGKRYGDGLFVPEGERGEFDGVTAPTPLGHFDLRTRSVGDAGRFRVLMEINHSYDFNDYYHPPRFPDDPIYSGSGSPGQPSIVYEAVIDTTAVNRYALMRAIGHGHHSGRDGLLYTEMRGIDSALAW